MTPTQNTINQLNDKVTELEALLQHVAEGCLMDHCYATLLEAALLGELDEGEIEEIRAFILGTDLNVAKETGLTLDQVTSQRIEMAGQYLQLLTEDGEQG